MKKTNFRSFNDFKNEIVRRCRKNLACKTEFKRVLVSKNFEQIVKVLTDNFYWSCTHNVLDGEFIEPLNDVLQPYGLCANQNVKVGFCIASGSSTVEASDSSTVIASDSSTVIASDSSTVIASDSSTVEAFGSSTVRAFGSSTVRAFGSSTVRAFDSSTVRAFGSSTVRAFDSSTVRAFGSSTVRAFGSSYICSYNTIEHKVSDKAICRYYHESRVVMTSMLKVN